MSYLRGDFYAYTSGDSEDDDSIDLHGNKPGCGCGEHKTRPCISLPIAVFDALVLMRYAQMTDDDKMKATAYAIDHGRGNGGSHELMKKVGARDWYDELEKWKETLSH